MLHWSIFGAVTRILVEYTHIELKENKIQTPATMNCSFLIVLLGLASVVYCQHNVIFEKIGEVTTTRSKWLVTFVIDLHPYQDFINSLKCDLTGAIIMAQTMKIPIINNNVISVHNRWLKSLNNLEQEIRKLNLTRSAISDMFEEYKSLMKRSKRAALPIVGKVLSFLFGTLSSEDLDSIRRNVNALAQNQQKITHVLQESLSILNVSRIEVAENRKSVNELLNAFAELHEDFRNVIIVSNERIFNLDRHVVMNSIIEGLSRLVTEAGFYIEHLQMQLNMLTLGHLSPSVISPKKLRSL